MSIGERIRKYRNEIDMTQRKLAEEVGLTESAIRNYERDIRTPGDGQIKRIAEALDVSPDAIRDIGVEGARGALEVLFRCERELGLSLPWSPMSASPSPRTPRGRAPRRPPRP